MVSVSRWTAWLLAGATLVAGLGLVAVLYTGQRGSEPAPDVPSPSAQMPAPSPDPQPTPQVRPPAPPAFDVVRVAEDGGTLVAGSALAGSAVVLRVDGEPVAETSADNAGQFVTLFTLAPSDAAQVMTLEMILADGRVSLSDDRVVLAPRPEALAALVEAAPGSVALALLQPEPSALPLGAASPPVSTAVAVAQEPGHEAASGALAGTEPPADDGAAVPVAGRDIPPAPAEVTEVAVPQPVVETADEPAAESLPRTATEDATGVANDSGTETGSETKAVTETVASTQTGTPAARDIAPETSQALTTVPGQTAEVAALALSDGETPPTTELPEVQEPGHEAAAAVLEGGRVVADVGVEAPVAVGEAPEPISEPVPETGAPAPRPRETPAETVASATTPEAAPAEMSPAGAVASEAAPAESLVPRAFVLRGSGAVDLLDRTPAVMDNIVIDMISYSDTGDVQISGRTVSQDAGTRVQIYLDNRPIALALAENGDWSSDLPAVDPGVYALRVDQLDGDGRVVSRFETPFQREDPALVRAARVQGTEIGAQSDARDTTPQAELRETGTARDTSDGAPVDTVSGETSAETATTATPVIEASATASADLAQPGAQQSVALVTVQPGHSLWRISEGHYGAGSRYLLIYNANRGQIRNPDLIYPGQIFVLPE